MNDPNACNEHFFQCHCVLPTGHDGPHECVPDPVCGGSWLRHPDDQVGMVRVYRYPSARPGCEAYGLSGISVDDPAPGEYVLEWDGIPRFPRGGITVGLIPGEPAHGAGSFLPPPQFVEGGDIP